MSRIVRVVFVWVALWPVSSPAQTEVVTINPWLRPHFTVTLKSAAALDTREASRKLYGERPLWFSPWTHLVDVIRPSVPRDIATSRTFLRCKGLGWTYGGHTLDVLQMNPVDYEGLRAAEGKLFRQFGTTGRMKSVLAQGDHRYLMSQDEPTPRTAVLSLPGGFSARPGHLVDALSHGFRRAESIGDSDWSVRFKPAELLDPPTWEVLNSAVAVWSQPRDGELRHDSDVRSSVGELVLTVLPKLHKELHEVALDARVDPESRRTTIRLRLDAVADSTLAEYFRSLQSLTVPSADRCDTRPDDVIAMTIALPGILQKTPAPDEPRSSTLTGILEKSTLVRAGITGASQSEATLWMTARAVNRPPDEEPASATGPIVAVRLIEDRQPCIVRQADLPPQVRHLVGLASTATLQPGNGGDGGESPETPRGFLMATVNVDQLLTICNPRRPAREPASGDIDSDWCITVTGHSSGDQLELRAELPARLEGAGYLLLETLVYGFYQLSLNLPFGSMESP
jgi:hypothetical protein